MQMRQVGKLKRWKKPWRQVKRNKDREKQAGRRNKEKHHLTGEIGDLNLHIKCICMCVCPSIHPPTHLPILVALSGVLTGQWKKKKRSSTQRKLLGWKCQSLFFILNCSSGGIDPRGNCVDTDPGKVNTRFNSVVC